MARFILGLGMVLATVAAAIRMIGGRAVLWLHPAVMAFLFVALVPACAVLAVWPRRELGRAFQAAFRPAAGPDQAAASRFWRFCERAVLAASALGLLAGLIITLSLLDADLPRLGSRLAASLVTPFYGTLLALACRILRARVERVHGQAP